MENQLQQAKLANGTLFKHAVDYLRSKKGDEAVKTLETTFGNIIFDSYKMYPLENLDKLQAEVLKLVYGSVTDESYYDLGCFTFEAFAHTLIGATLTNMVTTPKQMLEKTQVLWSAVINFGERKLVSLEETTGKALLEIKNDPRNPAYLRGILETALKEIQTQSPSIKLINQTDKGYQLEITWTP